MSAEGVKGRHRLALVDTLLTDRQLHKVLILLLIAILGLEMRMTAVGLTEVFSPLTADALDYFSYAYNIAENGVYSRTVPGSGDGVLEPDFLRSPGFPLFASLFFSSDANDFISKTLLAQLLINSLVIFAAMLTAWRYFGYWPAVALSLLFATSPHIINMNLYFLSESLMASLMVLLVSLVCLSVHGGGRTLWALTGLVLAYAALTRPYLQYFILIFTPYLLFAFKGKKLDKIAMLVLAYVAVTASWSVYVAQNGGAGADDLMVGTIHHGLYPNIEYNDDPETRGYPYRFDPDAAAIGTSMTSVLAELQRRFETEPLRHLQWYLVGKPLTLWQWSIIQGSRDIYIYPAFTPPWDYLGHFQLSYFLHKVLHYPLLISAFLFSVAVWIPRFTNKRLSSESKRFFQIISLLLIYGTAVHMVGAPFPRYQIPQKFMMFIMALGFAGYLGAWFNGMKAGTGRLAGSSWSER